MTQDQPTREPTPWPLILWDLVWIGVLFSLLIVPFLGERPLANPDEGRYMNIPREMLTSGDWITPRLNGVKYFEKPVLFYWFEALAMSFWGVKEWVGRLIPFLFGLFGVWGTYAAGHWFFSRLAGIYAALVLSSSLLYFALSNMIILDLTFSVLMGFGLLCFFGGMTVPPGLHRRLFAYGTSFFLACAFLTKGLAGLVLPGLVILIWVTLTKRWRTLTPLYLPTALLLFVCIAAPWHVLVGAKNPEFWQHYFIHEHFVRFATTVHRRFQPFWFFVPVFVIGMIPWISYIPSAIHRAFQTSDRGCPLFLALWISIIFLFFSFSNSKLIPYMLPIFMPTSLFLGHFFAQDHDQERSGASWRFALYVLLSLGLAIGLILFAQASDMFPKTLGWAVPWGVFCLMLGSLLWPFIKRVTLVHPEFLAIYIGSWFLFGVMQKAAPLVPFQTTKPLALHAAKLLPKDTPLYLVRTYPQDFPVYMDRSEPMPVVDWSGELDFGTHVEDTSGWILNWDTFAKRWETTQVVCAIVTHDGTQVFGQRGLRAYEVPLDPSYWPEINTDIKHTLMCNMEPTQL